MIPSLARCKVYYWRARPNFGDGLAPLLLRHFAGVAPGWSAAGEADVLVTGSVLHHAPGGWRGTVLGAGTLYPDSRVPELARYAAVRGPLTAALAGSRDAALGDPGLLAGELVTPESRTYEIGVVPHWSDRELTSRFGGAGNLFIDVTADPLLVVRQISACKRIVASSLHGIIVADALGIRRRVEMTPQLAREGGDHKFRDHAAAVGVPFKTGEWQAPVFSRVEDRQHELYDAFRSFGRDLRRQAWSAPAQDTE